MGTRPAKNGFLVAIIGSILIVGVFIAAIFSSQVAEADRYTIIVLVLVFSLAIFSALINRYFGKSLGRAMRASRSRAGDASALAEPELASVKRRSAPSQPFAYQVFDMNSTPDLSPAADALLKRAHKHYRSYVVNLAVGALLLWVSLSVVSLVSALLHSDLSISFDLLCGSMVALLAAFFIANPRRYPTSWTILIWGALNLLLLAPIIYVVIRSGVQIFMGRTEAGLVFLFILAGGVLAVYGMLFSILAYALRRQMAANKPLQLLALWVFNSANNLVSTLSGIGVTWQFLGTVQYLRGGDFTVDMGSLMRQKAADLVADTPEKLERGLQAFKYAPSWSGVYARNTLLCGDAVWKPAVHALLRNANAVAMSLFGFSESNQGCLYELGLLLDAFPIHRVLFLIDESTDLDFLLATLSKNWDNMTVDSPNRAERTAPVRIYRMSTRFDRPLEGYLLNRQGRHLIPGQTPSLEALGALSATQSTTARETECMLKLILEGVAR